MIIVEWLVLKRLDKVSKQLRKLNRQVKAMSETIDELTARVTEIEDAGDAAIALLQGLKAQLDAAIANSDMSAVAALSERLGAQAAELADAVVANTRAELI